LLSCRIHLIQLILNIPCSCTAYSFTSELVMYLSNKVVRTDALFGTKRFRVECSIRMFALRYQGQIFSALRGGLGRTVSTRASIALYLSSILFSSQHICKFTQ
jgi:hypothetical protein